MELITDMRSSLASFLISLSPGGVAVEVGDEGDAEGEEDDNGEEGEEEDGPGWDCDK